MSDWRYWEVTHQWHTVMNASTPARLEELGEAVGLRPGMRVLDVACGHADMLLRWNARFGVTGVGVDASPFTFERARRRVAEAGRAADLEIRHGRGEEFRSDERFDVACCVGASWIWKGHAGTLRALTAFAAPGGAVVVGEPYWIEEPPPEYLAVEGIALEEFHDLAGCLDVARGQGLELIWMAGSTSEEWDRYEMLQAAAVDRHAREHPDDPDLPAIRAKRRRHDEAYVRWGRRCLGWALWAFRVPGADGEPARGA